MRPRLRRRPLLICGGILTVVVLAWAAWAYAVVQTPRLDSAAPVDAVLVLGGASDTSRTQRALSLVVDGLTDTVVFSIPKSSVDTLAQRTCAKPPPGVNVICFRPDPSTTRGEARELGQLASAHDWTRVAVVTSAYHISRSRLIIGRCFGGTTLMLQSGESISALEWAYQWLYQTAGYAKAEVLQGC